MSTLCPRGLIAEAKRVVLKFFMLALSAGAAQSSGDDFQGATHLMPFEEDTIHYAKSIGNNPVSRLQERIDRGESKLRFQGESGYLESLLRELNISTNSQMLVFSKTSFQRERISPQTPRALYFNDDVYVGFIPGAPLMEVSAADPALGGVFYTIDQNPSRPPRLVRTDQCLECHASAYSMGVPGHLVRSFATDEGGVVDLMSGISQVNHRTPLKDRWAGWYVTGSTGGQNHRGNLIGKSEFERHEKDTAYPGDVMKLDHYFNVARYPGEGSDVVALMVLEHQTHLHNYLTRLNYEATIALRQYGHLNYLKSKIEAFVRYLLFVEEAPLTAPVKGNTPFAAKFVRAGPKDGKGRSLREFDLQTRMFKYPCSYLIYSESYNQLPAELKEQIYRKLWAILTGDGSAPEYRVLKDESRVAIREILADTRSDLPKFWVR